MDCIIFMNLTDEQVKDLITFHGDDKWDEWGNLCRACDWQPLTDDDIREI